MEIIAIIIVLVVGWSVSRAIGKNFRNRYEKLLRDISLRTEQISHLESKVQAQIGEALSLIHSRKHRSIGLEDLVILDRYVVYTKRPIATYYNTRSGEVLALSGSESTLIISKTEIESRDLQHLIASKSQRSRFQKPEEKKESKKDENIIPFRRAM